MWSSSPGFCLADMYSGSSRVPSSANPAIPRSRVGLYAVQLSGGVPMATAAAAAAAAALVVIRVAMRACTGSLQSPMASLTTTTDPD